MGQFDDLLDPDGRQPVDLQMRVVGQERPPAGRTRTGDGPGVRGHHPGRRAQPPERFGDHALAESDLLDETAIEPTQVAGKESVELIIGHAGLHHLDEQPLDLGL